MITNISIINLVITKVSRKRHKERKNSMENQSLGQCYGICYNCEHLVAIANPPHNKLDGFVYGTIQNHTNSDSAIAEYREYVKTNTEAKDAESYAEEVASSRGIGYRAVF